MISVLPIRMQFEPSARVDFAAIPGVTWRSALGARLRQDACITGKDDCAGCMARPGCVYGTVFDPAPDSQAPGLASELNNPPRPYVLLPRHQGGRFGPGRLLALDLVLMPGAFRHVDALVRACSRVKLGKAGMRLASCTVVPPGPSAELPFPDKAPAGGFPLKAPAVPASARIVIEQPVRLRVDNRYVGPDDFSFPIFMAALLRRISSLAGTSAELAGLDYRSMLDRITRDVRTRTVMLSWSDAARFSARQSRRVPLGGLVGEFTIEGALGESWPWLWAGQWTHVGKGVVMGLGRYRLESFPSRSLAS